LTNGHILLKACRIGEDHGHQIVGQALATEFHRIQFTPDLLPADLIGTMIYVPGRRRFGLAKGRSSPTSFWR